MRRARVGVLALQGASERHCAALGSMGFEAVPVRSPAQLADLSHLIIPGGESTTVAHLLDLFGLRQPIVDQYRAGDLAVFGTCAGAILVGREADERPRRLALADVAVERNAYGSQRDSFVDEVRIDGALNGGIERSIRGVFIRAPRFSELGSDVSVLGWRGDEPVLVRHGNVLAATFHPELTDEPSIHRYFIEDFDPACIM